MACFIANSPILPFKPPPNIWDISGIPAPPIISSRADISIPFMSGMFLGRLFGLIPICFIILFMSPDMTPCIMVFAWLKSLINLLTSTKLFPEPLAIRRRRLGVNKSGFSRSAGVIEDTIARFRAISRSSTFKLASAGLPAIPGIIFSRSSIGPIF
ncbi:Uncharacterised protein [Streptococcus suis]|nr:Uncharacterised protein [Streptococcus suis]